MNCLCPLQIFLVAYYLLFIYKGGLAFACNKICNIFSGCNLSFGFVYGLFLHSEDTLLSITIIYYLSLLFIYKIINHLLYGFIDNKKHFTLSKVLKKNNNSQKINYNLKKILQILLQAKANPPLYIKSR